MPSLLQLSLIEFKTLICQSLPYLVIFIDVKFEKSTNLSLELWNILMKFTSLVGLYDREKIPLEGEMPTDLSMRLNLTV